MIFCVIVVVLLLYFDYIIMLFLQARALCPQHAEADVIRFLVGSQSLKFENQVLSYSILFLF